MLINIFTIFSSSHEDFFYFFPNIFRNISSSFYIFLTRKTRNVSLIKMDSIDFIVNKSPIYSFTKIHLHNFWEYFFEIFEFIFYDWKKNAKFVRYICIIAYWWHSTKQIKEFTSFKWHIILLLQSFSRPLFSLKFKRSFYSKKLTKDMTTVNNEILDRWLYS